MSSPDVVSRRKSSQPQQRKQFQLSQTRCPGFCLSDWVPHSPRQSRDSFGPDAATGLKSANRHRIMRRGRSYGHRLENPLIDDGAERGLHFICLNSDIERQFEFVQQTWINNPVFGGLYSEVDPLIGNLPKGDCLFTVQAEPLRERVHNLSRFVTVRGGSYFFLPSIRALKYLASL